MFISPFGKSLALLKVLSGLYHCVSPLMFVYCFSSSGGILWVLYEKHSKYFYRKLVCPFHIKKIHTRGADRDEASTISIYGKG